MLKEDTGRGFPDTFAHLSTSELLAIWTAGPGRLRQAIDGLSDDELVSHPREGKWSIQQIAFHVVDAEVVGHFRMLAVLGSGIQEPVLAGYDQDSWTGTFDYETRSRDELRLALRHFASMRELLGAQLRRLDDSQWQRRGIHGEWGPLTLRQILELYADHPERHIDQIAISREILGKPKRLERIFDEWLYGSRGSD